MYDSARKSRDANGMLLDFWFRPIQFLFVKSFHFFAPFVFSQFEKIPIADFERFLTMLSSHNYGTENILIISQGDFKCKQRRSILGHEQIFLEKVTELVRTVQQFGGNRKKKVLVILFKVCFLYFHLSVELKLTMNHVVRSYESSNHLTNQPIIESVNQEIDNSIRQLTFESTRIDLTPFFILDFRLRSCNLLLMFLNLLVLSLFRYRWTRKSESRELFQVFYFSSETFIAFTRGLELSLMMR